MAAMFTMMNNARLNVGLQGVVDRRAGDAAGGRLCAGARAGQPRGPAGADRRASRRAADAAADEGADAGRAGAGLLLRSARPTGRRAATRRRGRARTC